jgi:hypothetical protein
MKKENKLGEGGYGAVYPGTFEGNAVAVKVPLLGDAIKPEQKREMEEHLQLDHENVLKLLHVDESLDKTYYKWNSKLLFYTFIAFSISFADASCSSYVPGH